MSRLVALLGTFLLAGCGQAALLSSSPAANTTAPTVGLPSPSAVPSAAFPTNSPTLSPAFEWQALGSVATQSQIRGLAASARGYVLLEGGTTVWFSPDAKKWSRVILPFNPKDKSASKGATAISIAASPTDFIVVGSFSHEPCVGLVADGGPPGCAVTPISWVSADGLSWTSSIAIPLPLQNLASPDYREFTEVWPAAGGWDAAVRTADSPDPIGKELLHSADGLTWSRLAVPPTLAGALHVSGRGGAAVADRRVMWQVWDAKYPGPTSTLATSTDGRTWTSLDEFQGKGATVGHALAPDAGTTGPWLLAGDVYMGGSSSAVIWSSLNLTTWQAATLTVPGAVSLTAPSSLTRWSGGYITVAKWSSNGQAASTNYATWVSTDGATWSAGPALPPTGADGQAFLAVGPNGLLAVRQEDGPTLVFLGP